MHRPDKCERQGEFIILQIVYLDFQRKFAFHSDNSFRRDITINFPTLN
jgi:hypothetical protein